MISGTDRLTWNLGIGAVLVTAAAVLCTLVDAGAEKADTMAP